jgi:hypothetical protein
MSGTRTINQEPITRALVETNDLVFYPKTENEAIFIQQRLFELGARWGSHGAVVDEVANCIAKGMICKRGELLYNPVLSEPYLHCTSEQFSQDFVPPERAFLIEQFRIIAERLERIEQRLDGIESELTPSHLDKRGLNAPGSGP